MALCPLVPDINQGQRFGVSLSYDARYKNQGQRFGGSLSSDARYKPGTMVSWCLVLGKKTVNPQTFHCLRTAWIKGTQA